ncbi:AzlC family ABC transporter permease [Propionibacterium acidifaciens]
MAGPPPRVWRITGNLPCRVPPGPPGRRAPQRRGRVASGIGSRGEGVQGRIPLHVAHLRRVLVPGVRLRRVHERVGVRLLVPTLMSLTVFGGSLEFVAVSMLPAPFAPAQVMAITCMVQARHLFYGIAMLDRYRDMGWKKAYLIFGLCDETFSINYSARIPEGVDRGWFYFFVTLLNHFYWVSGATIGGVAGSLVAFDTSGLEFVMTAMFVVIFLDQWLKERRHWTALIGVGAAAGCRLVFGADSFVVPTMVCILVLLMAPRRPIEVEGGLL